MRSSGQRTAVRVATAAAVAVLALAAVVAPRVGDAGEERAETRTQPRTVPISRFEDSGPPRTPPERRRREQLKRLQRPVTVALSGADPMTEVQDAITREAKRRFRSDESDDRVRRTVCDPPRRLYDGALAATCVASTSAGGGVLVGVPYVALVEADRRRATFCERTAMAGEGASLGQVRVPLPPPCRRVLVER